MFVNGDCAKLEFENFDTIFGSEEFKKFNIPIGNRTKTHDLILDIDAVGDSLRRSPDLKLTCDDEKIAVDTVYLAENINEFEINTFVVQKKTISYKVIFAHLRVESPVVTTSR